MAVVASTHQLLHVDQRPEQRTTRELEELRASVLAAYPRGLSADASALSLSSLKLDDDMAVNNYVHRQRPVPFWAASNNAAVGKQGKGWPATGSPGFRASAASPAGSTGSKDCGDAGKTPCAFFLRLGSCGFGDRCKFSHPAELAPRVQYNTHGLPLRPGAPDCSYYLKNHSCGFGPLCKYNHPDPGVSPASSTSSQCQWGSPSHSARGSLHGMGASPSQAPLSQVSPSHLQAVIAAQMGTPLPAVSAQQAPAAVPFVSMMYPTGATSQSQGQAANALAANQLLASYCPGQALGHAPALNNLSVGLLQARLGQLS